MARARYTAIIILLLSASCFSGLHPKKKKFREGSIEFRVTAVDTSVNPVALPANVVMKFRDDYTSATAEFGFGLMRLTWIADPVKKEFLTGLFFLQKYQSRMDTAEIRKTRYYLPEYDVQYGDSTRQISGYKCRNAILKFRNGDPSYQVWYTKEIGIKNPNWANAYYKIDGVLMDYRMKLLGLDLQYTAVTVSQANIDAGYFTLPAEYQTIPHSEMERMLESFFQ
jgi:hypothetical protein